MDTRRVGEEPATASAKEEMRPLNPAAMELETAFYMTRLYADVRGPCFAGTLRAAG